MIVADTHALLWWIAHPAELSPAAHTAIIASDQLGIAAISVWEIAFLTQRGRILRDADIENWFVELFELPGTELLAITPSIGHPRRIARATPRPCRPPHRCHRPRASCAARHEGRPHPRRERRRHHLVNQPLPQPRAPGPPPMPHVGAAAGAAVRVEPPRECDTANADGSFRTGSPHWAQRTSDEAVATSSSKRVPQRSQRKSKSGIRQSPVPSRTCRECTP